MDCEGEIGFQRWASPVCNERAGQLDAFLRHKGTPWIGDIRRRLAGAIDGSRDYFYVAEHAGRLAGHAWCVVAESDPRLGLVGHIFTHPDFRRRGIASRLLARVLDDFERQGGEVLQLFTSTPYSVPFYERFGFETVHVGHVYHDHDWYMQYPGQSAARVAAWLAAGGPTIRPLRPADMPQYCLLYNVEHDTLIKDRAQQVGCGLEAELAFIDACDALADNRGACLVLDNSAMLSGAATLRKSHLPCESHTALFDYYVPPVCQPQATTLIQSCLALRGKFGVDIIYAVATETVKQQQLARCGFVPCGELPGHFRVAEHTVDGRLMRWE